MRSDPYDLLAYYRENGVTRSRGHTGALCCGVEELIHWLSQFLTLEPGMVLHLGATGQDGLPAGPPSHYGPDYHAECEIERIGVLRNPIVAPATHDWRGDDEPGRCVHPVPVVRKLVAEGRTSIRGAADWKVRDARHFWTLLANSQEGAALERSAPRPYPLAYNAPAGSLARAGSRVVLPPVTRVVTGVCELAVVIRSITREVAPEDASRHILGFVALAVLRDSSFAEALVRPHPLQAPIPDIYCRWPEGFNIVSATPVALDNFRGRRMRFAVAGVGEVEHSTDAYLLDAPQVVAELSRGITLLPGDVIALGLPGRGLEMPAGQRLPENARLTASIDGVAEVSALIADRRHLILSYHE